MAEFRLGTKRDLPKLTLLWQECFGDSPGEINSFWSALFDEIRVYVAIEGGKPVSMLCALPLSLVDENGGNFPAAYLYAVCTVKKFRGQGLCGKLMAFAESALKKEGKVFACLVPSEETLFHFYEKLGYHTAFYHKNYTLGAQKANVKITKIDSSCYQNLRQMQLYGNFTDYASCLLDWQKNVSEATGAGLFRIETEDGVYCAAAEKWENRLHIKELLPDSPEAAASLAAHLHCKEALVRTEGTDQPFGMIKALGNVKNPEYSYLGFAFD